MTFRRKEIGKSAEDLALKEIKKQGLKVLERNFKTKFGEIDILAEDKEAVVIVEVKAKTQEQYGDPKEAVDWKKKRKLWQLGKFLEMKYPGRSIRIDVVAIKFLEDKLPIIEYIKNAVTSP